jgi:hypothetical protein
MGVAGRQSRVLITQDRASAVTRGWRTDAPGCSGGKFADRSARKTAMRSAVRLVPDETRRPPPDPALTRHNVANKVPWGYLILVGIVVTAPIALMLLKGMDVDDATKITIALSSTLSGLAGVLGYVMGFYFKGEEQKERAAAAKTRSVTPTRRRVNNSATTSIKQT